LSAEKLYLILYAFRRFRDHVEPRPPTLDINAWKMAYDGEPIRYAREDTEVTTQKELLGWYSYGLAAEVFAVCGVGQSLDPSK